MINVTVSDEKYLKTYPIKLTLFALILLAVFLLLLILSLKFGIFTTRFIDVSECVGQTIIIDPGHGGKDSGADGVYGKKESALCLEISEKIYKYLSLSGYNCVMTRTADTELTAENKELSRKQGDLQGRVEFANSYPDAIFVSIHMNTFPSPTCKGAQIFYSPNSDESKILSDIIKSKISLLQPDNTRENKMAGTNIYVLKNLEIPSVLIECGFLTNKNDESNLNNPEYQNILALYIASGICEYAENRGKG